MKKRYSLYRQLLTIGHALATSAVYCAACLLMGIVAFLLYTTLINAITS